MKFIEYLLSEEMVPVGKGNIPGPKMRERGSVEASIQKGISGLNDAVASGNWKYAESLLSHMLQQVQNLTAGSEGAPSLEKPSMKI
jgi:hypothetical protein